ncbi:uncharacterized protein BDR25DRAFT_394406 [Lindgomyces ingoldianus]|uniref:Uncharacterized protein n=1 Tax=Lindgomyces ingoldianus TaxID=673940 RepID=A0ACB6QTM9_9PLEO|nr:uncharacterized protein BDR25DRAFT_394406 [Lindgomyces ingoldianus]KAF2469447.1 hypothetical protein BDR25DRAFT_394406 [Lindgomyces ingoldianus]
MKRNIMPELILEPFFGHSGSNYPEQQKNRLSSFYPSPENSGIEYAEEGITCDKFGIHTELDNYGLAELEAYHSDMIEDNGCLFLGHMNHFKDIYDRDPEGMRQDLSLEPAPYPWEQNIGLKDIQTVFIRPPIDEPCPILRLEFHVQTFIQLNICSRNYHAECIEQDMNSITNHDAACPLRRSRICESTKPNSQRPSSWVNDERIENCNLIQPYACTDTAVLTIKRNLYKIHVSYEDDDFTGVRNVGREQENETHNSTQQDTSTLKHCQIMRKDHISLPFQPSKKLLAKTGPQNLPAIL